jgi:DNA polymerase-3 subunit chi
MAGGDFDADQPILLRADTVAVTDGCLMCVDGAEVTADEIAACERVCILFDGLEDAAVSRARVQWKTLTDAGAVAQYWSQASGRWEKKAEANADASG